MAYKVDIINIENNVNNILLTDDLTIEILKVRYNWILNASIRNAVLGLDDYGLVWYMGEWICGEWEDGTWYSGIFHDGIWKKGKWYSYLLDKSMILTKRFVIIEEDKMYSQFLNGKWWNGEWYNGIFGNDNDVSGSTTTQVLNESVNSPYWYNGQFYNGLFKNSVWLNGIFNNGSFKDSYWVKGKFYNGTFDNYEWWEGDFFGGDFVKGLWKTGTFNQIKVDILARFGTQSGTTSDGTLTTWVTGIFENGQFMSGLVFDNSGNTIASPCHHTTHWKDGIFNNGLWYGGHFEKGNFNYGNWYGGIFNIDVSDEFSSLTIWKNGIWNDGLWMNGVFKSGMFLGGMWLNGIFENGFLISEYIGSFTDDLTQNVVPKVLPPLPVPPSYSAPSVSTVLITGITYNSCDVKCNVTNTGGLSTIRGVCFSVGNVIQQVIYLTFYGSQAGFSASNQGGSGVVPLVGSVLTNNSFIVDGTTILSFDGSTINLSQPSIGSGYYYPSPTTQTKLTSNLPTINDFSFYDVGTDLGYYTDTIIGLNQDTTYYVRAFAINSLGVSYGELLPVKTHAANVPVVITNDSTVSSNRSDLSGKVVSSDSTISEFGFVYSLNPNPYIGVSGSIKQQTISSFITPPFNYIDTILNLLPVTKYYYVAYAKNISTLIGYGLVKSFTTTISKPTITTKSVTNITSYGMQSGGIITFNGGSPIIERGIIYSINTPVDPLTGTKMINLSGNNNFTNIVTNLAGYTTYYVIAYATNSVGTSYGDEIMFMTLPVVPNVITTSITNILSTEITSGGDITFDGGSSIIERGIVYSVNTPIVDDYCSDSNIGTILMPYGSMIVDGDQGLSYYVLLSSDFNLLAGDVTKVGLPSPDGVTQHSTYYSTTGNKITEGGVSTGLYGMIITGLTIGTTYHIKAFATNSVGIGYGSEITFSTLSIPTLTTLLTSVHVSDAISGGNISSDGGTSVTERGVCWSTSTNPNIGLTTKTSNGTGTGTFTSSITGLNPNILYYVRAYATNILGTAYGNQLTFTTPMTLPTVITNDFDGYLTTSTAGGGGEVTSEGGGHVNIKGVCYSISVSPTISNDKTIDGSGLGVFSSDLTELIPNTLYYVRAYAQNQVGISYGNQKTFHTADVTASLPPAVQTDSVIVVAHSITAYGTVTIQGSTPVYDRGFCYNTSDGPTIANSVIHSGSGIGSFTSTWSPSLNKYWVRAFATNSGGTAYGNTFVVITV